MEVEEAAAVAGVEAAGEKKLKVQRFLFTMSARRLEMTT